jgi:hypothetical protein
LQRKDHPACLLKRLLGDGGFGVMRVIYINEAAERLRQYGIGDPLGGTRQWVRSTATNLI